MLAISVSQCCTHFNVPHGANEPEEGSMVENDVGYEELVQSLGQTGLQDLSNVRHVEHAAISDEPVPMLIPMPVESDRSPDTNLKTKNQ